MSINYLPGTQSVDNTFVISFWMSVLKIEPINLYVFYYVLHRALPEAFTHAKSSGAKTKVTLKLELYGKIRVENNVFLKSHEPINNWGKIPDKPISSNYEAKNLITQSSIKADKLE